MDEAINKIHEIIAFGIKGDYIFRGESSYSGKVSSSLYRELKDRLGGSNTKIDSQLLDSIQKELIESVKKHYGEHRSDKEILTELRHYEAKINVIDFTKNILIALFFACGKWVDKSTEIGGRILCLNKKAKNVKELCNEKKDLKKDQNKIIFFDATGKHSRVIFQSSVFVHSSKGYIDIDKYMLKKITVENNLKKDILEILEGVFNIHKGTVYNDIHGFIKYEVDRIIAHKIMPYENMPVPEATDNKLVNEEQKGKTLKRISATNDKKER